MKTKTGAKRPTAKRPTAKRSSAKRPSGKRDTIKVGTKTMYAKRKSSGQFSEMDEKGRSLAADRRVKAKTVTKSGFGDQGDQGPRTTKGT